MSGVFEAHAQDGAGRQCDMLTFGGGDAAAAHRLRARADAADAGVDVGHFVPRHVPSHRSLPRR